MANEDVTREQEGVEPEIPELEDKGLEDVSGGTDEDNNNNINN
jgi:hypothetical protein